MFFIIMKDCFISSLKRTSQALVKKTSQTLVKRNFNNPLPGIEVGIPVTIFENIFTTNHYGFDITTPKILLLQFGTAYLTYGFDRLFDSDETTNATNKKELYKYYNDNKASIITSLSIIFVYTSYLLLETYETTPFIFLLFSTFKYKDIKPYLGQYKPVYIAIMWTIASYVLPCVIHDHDYSCLSYPIDYLPMTLTIFGTSNLADAKDVMEDYNNNITTIPVRYGYKFSNTLSVFALFLSSILFFINHNYNDRPIINNLYEIQNIVSFIIPLITNNTILKLCDTI